MNKRIQWSVPQLLDLEKLQQGLSGKPSPILKAYKVWQEGGAPGMIIDRSARDALDYRNLNHRGRYSWASGILRDFPLRYHAWLCAHEYQDCKEATGHTIRWNERHYARLLLPLPDGNLSCISRSLV